MAGDAVQVLRIYAYPHDGDVQGCQRGAHAVAVEIPERQGEELHPRPPLRSSETIRPSSKPTIRLARQDTPGS